VAIVWGLACHSTFGLGVLAMLVGLHEGLRTGLGRLEGTAALVANAALVLQFPLLHSLLLSKYGGPLLARAAPLGLGRALATTTYGIFASLQVLVTFALWSPSGAVWFEATGGARLALDALYAGSWLLVVKGMHDAGLGVQSGSLGWFAVARGQDPVYGPMPTKGLFRACRQPIYVAFALTLWTGAVWTPDRLALALVWTGYCLVGPLLKERRYEHRFGDAFRRYRAEVPYLLPRFRGPAKEAA
jgi:methanethiol S-methyltransferase